MAQILGRALLTGIIIFLCLVRPPLIIIILFAVAILLIGSGE